MSEWELEKTIESLKKDLDGRKTYYYKEEIWRDSDRLKRLEEELKNLQEEDTF